MIPRSLLPFMFSGSAYVVASGAPLHLRVMAGLLKPFFGDRIGICDGTADDIQIQAAMDALPSGGGSVILSAGSFALAAQVQRSIDGISIIGQGKSTRLNFNASTALINAQSQSGWMIANLDTDAGGIAIDSATNTFSLGVWKNTTGLQRFVGSVEMENPDTAFELQTSDSKRFFLIPLTTDGGHFAVWDKTETLYGGGVPRRDNVDPQGTFAFGLYGDMLVGDIWAILKNPMQYGTRRSLIGSSDPSVATTLRANRHDASSAATFSLESLMLDDGGVFTDDTTDINDAGANDVPLLPAIPATPVAAYFGSEHEYEKLTINIGTAGVGTWVISWEYWNGSIWTSLGGISDGTTRFTVGGSNDVTFTQPTNWATTAVNGKTAYWIRARVTTFTSIATQPLATQAFLVYGDQGTGASISLYSVGTDGSNNDGYVTISAYGLLAGTRANTIRFLTRSGTSNTEQWYIASAGNLIDAVGHFVEQIEMTAPSAPAANKSRLFTQDNGSGKTQLAVRFPTGAIQIIATEP